MSDPERVIHVGRWRQFATMLGGAFAVFIGRRADERASDAEYEASNHTWTWYELGQKHEFWGTPAEYRLFKGEK